MNPYLKTGGRLVGLVVFAVGVCLVLGGFWLIAEAIANWFGEGLRYTRPLWPVRWLEAGIICEALAVACFRYRARLKREERSGVQI